MDCVPQIFARNELYFPGGTYTFERMELDGSQCNVWIFIEEILLFWDDSAIQDNILQKFSF